MYNIENRIYCLRILSRTINITCIIDDYKNYKNIKCITFLK